ncbi:hypothetical protein K2173_009771 [Erythroxylum novogranatense]|uniref:galactinol--sucrose galactosyltransferase n=1 Tax=Erythroxylum novogranatense TaxID=1862640 RepID=A0AAV8SZW7_9ROSI|nr:hypothetical protein K2173_009771 [Erythroxylum novogranatense]
MAHTNPANNIISMNMNTFSRHHQSNICLSLPFLTLNSHGLRFLSRNSRVGTSKTHVKKWKHSMFISNRPVIKEGTFGLNGQELLTGVPDNVSVTPLTGSSAFLGANSSERSSRHVFNLGVIENVRFLSLFRFKLFWMIPRVGDSGSDVPAETQMLLMELIQKPSQNEPISSPSYALFLPALDGEFRSSLQGNSSNELELCVESGDPAIVTSQSLKAVFVNHGNHPFDLMKESMKILADQTGTFAVRETKQVPGILDCFGWCTWDAFYQKVNPQGIKDGLKSLSDGGTPPKFVLIDDGWQDTVNEFQKDGEPFVEGSQFGGRLATIKENSKFRKTDESLVDLPTNLKEFYNPTMAYPVQSPGNLANSRDLSLDCMEKYGIGVMDPGMASEFYNDLHGYLASQDVDGVKVDVQSILEAIAGGLGGRVSLTRRFQQALEDSIATNFKDNSIICCMGHSIDSIYNAKRSAVTRVSDDYYPDNPTTQTLHVAAVAFNSIFLGEVFVPDWDMFYSLHESAEFHAIARAVGGCGVYVSDKPGRHDFDIIKKLVLPDGLVLRAKYPGRPSRDCLFTDPVMDGKSLLKIWNLNKCTGVIGVFNCQGAGNWPCMNTEQKETSVTAEVSGELSPGDIEYFEEVSGKLWTGECAIYSFITGSVSRLPKERSFIVSLNILKCDVFTVSPIKLLSALHRCTINRFNLHLLGLINMYNSGGAVESVDHSGDSSTCKIHIQGRGAGKFGAYSSVKPKSCFLNSKEEEFVFREEDNLLTITMPSTTIAWDIDFCY